jgi:clan AA aspartic protease
VGNSACIEIVTLTLLSLLARIVAVGIFHVDIDVMTSSGADAERHTVLVDTGASYLSLPGSVLLRLGYRPVDRQRVILATGQVAIWPVTEVKVRLAERERTVIAFFADEASPKLVGAQTLESFGLGVDPLGRRLIPVDAYLAAEIQPASIPVSDLLP